MSAAIRLLVLLVLVLGGCSQAQAQDHSVHQMQEEAAPDPHAGHKMPGVKQTNPHAGHTMPATSIPDVATSADVPGRPTAAPPPAAAISDPQHAADRTFGPEMMRRAREQLRSENGAMRTSVNILDQLETTFSDGHEGYAWDAQGWYGGDVHRLWWKSEGEGVFGETLDEAELQLLYGRAVTPYFDVQAGVRQLYTSGPDRSDLVVSIQGLAPYWFEVDSAAFLSSKGELRVRAETEYDLRVTQRLILQVRGEINLSAEDIPELDIGSGLTSVEVGARLRYEFSRQFAPYAGIEWTGATGNTRSLIRRAGEDADETRFVVGIRAWF